MTEQEYRSASDLARLFVEAGERHHLAFAESDGVDPEWPLFYAAYVQTKLWDKLGVLFTRSELIHLLVAADLAIAAEEETESWSKVYARRVMEFATQKAGRHRQPPDKPAY